MQLPSTINFGIFISVDLTDAKQSLLAHVDIIDHSSIVGWNFHVKWHAAPLMLAVLEKLMLVLAFLIVDNWGSKILTWLAL